MNKKELMCKQLDAFIEDEEKATKEYHAFEKKFVETYPGAIFHSLAIDEKKHANLLITIWENVCVK